MDLFNMEFFSSATAMILVVNLITQVFKEIILGEKVNKRIPKLITLAASTLVVGVHHYTIWKQNPMAFHHSLVELIFLAFINSVFIAALSMGNYKILNITKDRQVKKIKEEMYIVQIQMHQKEQEQKEKEWY